MASSTLPLSPSFAPSATVCFSSKWEAGGGVSMVTCEKEIVLQYKSRQRARVLLSIPPLPPGPSIITARDEVSRRTPSSQRQKRNLLLFILVSTSDTGWSSHLELNTILVWVLKYLKIQGLQALLYTITKSGSIQVTYDSFCFEEIEWFYAFKNVLGVRHGSNVHKITGSHSFCLILL